MKSLSAPAEPLRPLRTAGVGIALCLATGGAKAASVDCPPLDLDTVRWQGEVAEARRSDGKLVFLTLEQRYQLGAERLLRRARAEAAAAVVVDARTSKVLVWAQAKSAGEASLLETASTPSASLFKIVTGAALLERSPVTPNWSICTQGGEHGISSQHLSAPTSGLADCGPFWQALGFSRNAAFARLAVRHLSPKALGSVAASFGFNRELPFDAPLPMGVLELPADELEFARTAIGFRNVSLSLLGAAQLAKIVAKDGLATPIHIVASEDDCGKSSLLEAPRRVLKAVTARRLKRMLSVTVHSGTSRRAFTNPQGQSYLGDVRAAGKTGTLSLDNSGRFASWFTGFAPVDSPEIVVAVLLKNPARWHQRANEVARDLFRLHLVKQSARGVTSPFETADAPRPTPKTTEAALPSHLPAAPAAQR